MWKACALCVSSSIYPPFGLSIRCLSNPLHHLSFLADKKNITTFDSNNSNYNSNSSTVTTTTTVVYNMPILLRFGSAGHRSDTIRMAKVDGSVPDVDSNNNYNYNHNYNNHNYNTIRMAKVDGSVPDVDGADSRGFTAFHAAAAAGDVRLMAYLREQGVAVGGRNGDGITPLFSAAENGHEEAVRFLLRHGADVNAATKVNITTHCSTDMGRLTPPIQLRSTRARTGGSTTRTCVRGGRTKRTAAGRFPTTASRRCTPPA